MLFFNATFFILLLLKCIISVQVILIAVHFMSVWCTISKLIKNECHFWNWKTTLNRVGIIYNFLISVSIKLLRYIDIIGSDLWPSFLAFTGMLNFENWNIIKDFTWTFMNKHKLNRISDQTITKVAIRCLFMVLFAKFKALQKAWNVLDFIED